MCSGERVRCSRAVLGAGEYWCGRAPGAPWSEMWHSGALNQFVYFCGLWGAVHRDTYEIAYMPDICLDARSTRPIGEYQSKVKNGFNSPMTSPLVLKP